MLELLESRRLFAASLSEDGVLTITGTAGNDRISATINTPGDTIFVIVNRQGYNFATADVKSVVIHGNRGNDWIRALLTNQISFAGIGVGPAALINGGGGNDALIGGFGDDTLNGHEGHDYLEGGSGTNQLNGGDGHDTLTAGSGPDDLTGGAGIDTVDYSDRQGRFTGVSVTLDDLANDGALVIRALDIPEEPEADNVHSDVENVTGTAGDDKIVGGKHANRLIGGNGNDTLIGGGGRDTLFGFNGKDLLEGGPGADLMGGGRGSDTVDYSSRTTLVWVNLADNEANDGATDGSTTEADNVLDDVENLIGGSGVDSFFGTAAGNTFVGNGGNDVFQSEGGADLLIGGAGNDLLQPGTDADDSADVLEGGRGEDTVQSLTGADVVRGAAVEKVLYWSRRLRNDVIVAGGEGTGWFIELGTTAGGSTLVMVDVTTNDLVDEATSALTPPGFVRVTGTYEIQNLPEAGPTLVVVAEEIAEFIE